VNVDSRNHIQPISLLPLQDANNTVKINFNHINHI